MNCFQITCRIAALAILLVSGMGAAARETPESPGDAAQGPNHLAGAIIFASDIDRSIEFYTDVMGLKVVARVENENGLAEILLSTSGKFLQGMMLTLQPAHKQAAAEGVDRAALGELMFMSPSNSAMAQRLREAGYEVTERDPQHLYTSDPDGYKILVYELDPRILNAAQ